jgi:hypothetical protein
MLEDQIYVLEDELNRSEAALQACQGGSARAPRSGEAPARSRAEAESSRLPPVRGPHLTPGNGDAKSPVDPRSLRLPDVEIPGQPLPSGAFPKTLAPPAQDAPPGRSGPSAAPGGVRGPVQRNGAPNAPPTYPAKPSAHRGGARPSRYAQDPRYAEDPRYAPDPRSYAGRESPPRLLPPATGTESARLVDPRVVPAQAIALDPRADNRRVDRITLNRVLTGGYERDARFGDAGVTVLVEPRDAQGQLAPAAGPISVVILDRAKSGDAARVARWDFTAEQTASLYRKTPYGEGIYLEMPWAGNPPTRSHLHMFVRYMTKDGRSVEASREVDVALPSQRQQAWTSLTTSAAEPAPVEMARSWRQKPRRDDEPSVLSAVAHEPIGEPETRTTRPAEKPQRPEWSPLRP